MRRRWVLVALVGAAVGVWLGLAAREASLARDDARAGVRAISAAREAATPSGVMDGAPQAALARARRAFGAAERRADGLLWRPLVVVPVLGRQIRSVRAISSAAGDVTDVALGGMAQLRAVLSAPPTGPPQRLDLVRRIRRLAHDTEATLGEVDLGPRTGLVSSLAEARNDLARHLADVRSALRDADAATAALTSMLEGGRYLVLGANNAEMRAGSGMVLSVGQLETSGGALALDAMTTVGDVPVPEGAVAAPAQLAALWGFAAPMVDWRNVMMTPRYDVSAPLAAEMWVAAGRPPVDGVLLVDVVALRAIISATGPLTVDGREFTRANTVDELLVRQYRRFRIAQRVERRDQLGRLAEEAFAALDAGRWDPAVLAEELMRAARGRHLLVWSPDAAAQAGWRAANVDGTLGSDSLMVTLLNRGNNKLDRFTTLANRLTARSDDRGIAVELTIDLRNDVAPGEPPYIAGDGRQVDRDTYPGILSVTLPTGATAVTVDGMAVTVTGPDGPTSVVAGSIDVPPRATRTIRMTFRLPPAAVLRIESSARVPPARWKADALRWEDREARTIAFRHVA